MLSAKALIVARPKIGTRVRPKADWNMLDPEVLAWHLQATPTETSSANCSCCARWSSRTRRRSRRQRIRAPRSTASPTPTGRMDRFKDGAGDLIGADLDFHMGILEATGNRFLAALGGLIHASLECTFGLSWEGAARIQDDRLLQHHGIFEAIRDGSPELAKTRMSELLSDSMNDVRQYLKQRDAAAERAGARPL